MWEWDVRVLDIQGGVEGDYTPICVGGRGAAPPEFCGGPTGYRLMLKRQREGAASHGRSSGWVLSGGDLKPGVRERLFGAFEKAYTLPSYAQGTARPQQDQGNQDHPGQWDLECHQP